MSGLKEKTLIQLQKQDVVYVIYSKCTRMPFVFCDPESYDDEIFVFYNKEDADRESERLSSSGNPAQVIKIERKSFLAFYARLVPAGRQLSGH